MNLNKINESKVIKIVLTCATCLLTLFVIATFAQYYSIKLNFNNPLISESLVENVQFPYLIKGLILLVGIVLIFILKYLKQIFFAFILAFLLIVYYILSDHFIGWNPQIN